jgi:hypothetical protein
MTSGEQSTKSISNATINRVRGTNKLYEEAIEASAKFNKRLVRERKMRIPFIDSQTTVAQGNCMIWNQEYQRSTEQLHAGVVYHYPVKKWYKNRRLIFENPGMLHRIPITSSVDLSHQQLGEMDSAHMHGSNNSQHVLIKQSSNSNDDYEHFKLNSASAGMFNNENNLKVFICN